MKKYFIIGLIFFNVACKKNTYYQQDRDNIAYAMQDFLKKDLHYSICSHFLTQLPDTYLIDNFNQIKDSFFHYQDIPYLLKQYHDSKNMDLFKYIYEDQFSLTNDTNKTIYSVLHFCFSFPLYTSDRKHCIIIGALFMDSIKEVAMINLLITKLEGDTSYSIKEKAYHMNYVRHKHKNIFIKK